MTAFGVDGCPAGWFFVCITEHDGWSAGIEPDFEALWPAGRRGRQILVDIPLGLHDEGPLERLCDLDARRLLGWPRRASVFPAPARPTLQAESYAAASAMNRLASGRGLSRQTWNILPKIREVDALLQQEPGARGIVREVHPELLFWALNGGRSMKHNKKKAAGFQERRAVLSKRYPLCADIARIAAESFPRRAVGRDDILDALAAALTGHLAGSDLRTAPVQPELDPTGLPMEMVYWMAPDGAPEASGPVVEPSPGGTF